MVTCLVQKKSMKPLPKFGSGTTKKSLYLVEETMTQREKSLSLPHMLFS